MCSPNFRFLKDATTGIVSFKVKISPIDEKWIGRPDHPDVGFVMLKSTPTGFPAVISPTPVPDAKICHVRSTFPYIGQDATNWWNQFFINQTFWCPGPQAAYDAGIWDIQPPPTEPIEPVGPLLPNRRPMQVTITMGEQRIASLEELEVGMLVAVHPTEAFYPDNYETDTLPTFWLGEITGFLFILLVFYYCFSKIKVSSVGILWSSAFCCYSNYFYLCFISEKSQEGATVTIVYLRLAPFSSP